MVRITDRPDMTSAVYGGHKALNQTNKTFVLSIEIKLISSTQGSVISC